MKLSLTTIIGFVREKLIYFSVVWLFIILGLYFYFIDKSFYFADEAFYLLSLDPDIYKIEASQWGNLYSFLYFDNLIIDKVIFTAIQLLSVTFFSITATRLFFNKKRYYWSIAIATIASMYLLVGPNAMSVPYYITLGTVVSLIATSFLFLFFNYRYRFSLYLSGFFIGVLPFLMITTVPTFLLFLALLWFYDKKLKSLLFFSSGIASFFIFYFLVIQSPSDFLFKFKEVYLFMQADNSHGILGILVWCAKIFVDKIALGLFFLVYYYTNKKYNFKKWLTVLTCIFFIIWMCIILVDFIFLSSFLSNTRVFYFLAFALLIEGRHSIEFKKNILIIFLLILPFFALLGTNLPFFIRTKLYFPFIFIALVFLIKFVRNKIVIISFSLSIIVCSIMYISSPFRFNREGFKGIEQNQKFTSLKGTIYLDKERLKMLEEVKPYIENKNNVIVSHPLLHGLVYLLNGKPPFLFFTPYKATETFLIENEYDYKSYILIDYKKFPFHNKFLDNVTKETIHNFNKIETENFIIYTNK